MVRIASTETEALNDQVNRLETKLRQEHERGKKFANKIKTTLPLFLNSAPGRAFVDIKEIIESAIAEYEAEK